MLIKPYFMHQITSITIDQKLLTLTVGKHWTSMNALYTHVIHQ